MNNTTRPDQTVSASLSRPGAACCSSIQPSICVQYSSSKHRSAHSFWMASIARQSPACRQIKTNKSKSSKRDSGGPPPNTHTHKHRIICICWPECMYFARGPSMFIIHTVCSIYTHRLRQEKAIKRAMAMEDMRDVNEESVAPTATQRIETGGYQIIQNAL